MSSCVASRGSAYVLLDLNRTHEVVRREDDMHLLVYIEAVIFRWSRSMWSIFLEAIRKYIQEIQNKVVSFEVVDRDLAEGWALCNIPMFRGRH